MRRAATLLVIGGAMLLAGGCDPITGVSRNADLGVQPEIACVRHAIETTDGVAALTYHPSREGESTSSWVYAYEGPPGSGIRGALQLRKDENGRLSYSNSRLEMGPPASQSEIDATRPVMRAMEKNIAARCGVTELASGVSEKCTGVTCKPLPD